MPEDKLPDATLDSLSTSDFITEARHRCRYALANTGVGRWLDEALDRLARLDPGPLNYQRLRTANRSRAARWRGGSAATIEFATIELAGETGELCNRIKKFLRAMQGMPGGEADLGEIADEIADVVICTDLLADILGLDLGPIIQRKFNKTSEKHGFPERL